MSRSGFSRFKDKAKNLRIAGKTYSEINLSLGVVIPKSTLSLWFKELKLPKGLSERLRVNQIVKIEDGRVRALRVNREKRNAYLTRLFEKNKYLADLVEGSDVAKVALATLYLGEGTKNPKRGLLTFGNSDPRVISLFLKLLRKCYRVDEMKFRCTVQCRADQNTRELRRYWRSITKIPYNRFYDTRIDPRTVGKKTRSVGYKGVCRIDYFSSEVFNDILKAIEVIAGR